MYAPHFPFDWEQVALSCRYPLSAAGQLGDDRLAHLDALTLCIKGEEVLGLNIQLAGAGLAIVLGLDHDLALRRRNRVVVFRAELFLGRDRAGLSPEPPCPAP